VNDTLYLIDDDGEVSALRAKPVASRASRTPPPPPPEAAPAPEPAPSSDAGPVPNPGG